jgi:pimeloyl-ACP methyl ester carboxylesterase
MAEVRCAGGVFGYDEAGGGPGGDTVVLIHAGIADRRMWDHQFAALAKTHRVIRYDWRGYGESAHPAEAYAHHRDLLALLDALEVRRAALVGCSMGGSFALEAALAAPERVTAVVAICSGLSGRPWPQEMIDQARERVHHHVPAERLAEYRAGRTTAQLARDAAVTAQAHIAWMVAGPGRDRSALDPAVWERSVLMYREHLERSWSGEHPQSQELPPDPPPGERLSQLAVPTLVINGAADVPQIQEVSRLLAREVRDARFLELPETGHLPPLERPAEVTAAIGEFLAGQR